MTMQNSAQLCANATVEDVDSTWPQSDHYNAAR